MTFGAISARGSRRIAARHLWMRIVESGSCRTRSPRAARSRFIVRSSQTFKRFGEIRLVKRRCQNARGLNVVGSSTTPLKRRRVAFSTGSVSYSDETAVSRVDGVSPVPAGLKTERPIPQVDGPIKNVRRPCLSVMPAFSIRRTTSSSVWERSGHRIPTLAGFSKPVWRGQYHLLSRRGKFCGSEF